MRRSAPLLRVQDVSVTHADAAHPAPHDVSFEVHPSEVVLLLGPSGSGKSTLTLALNGLIPQAVDARLDGTVEVLGRDTRTTSVAQLSTDISMVFQDPDSQLVTGTVLDEVAFALENLLLPASEILERVEHALRQVGLWNRRGWNPDLLSGGGRQRLAIACALAMRSRVIVLDEPTANLDPQGVEDVYRALGELTGDDRAIVLVEHNLTAAMRFATRVIVLDRDGRMLFDGPAQRTLSENTAQLLKLGVWLPAELLPPTRPLHNFGDLHDLGDITGIPPRLRRSPGERDAGGRPTGSLETGDLGPAITVRDLVVTKRGAAVLSIPSLEIAAGSFTAIVGPNGAGKTTLLQALGGVVPPSRGAVMIGDLDAGQATPKQLAAHVGFVFQNPEHQFIAPTVREELAHGLRLQRLAETEIDARVGEMLDRFGLRYRAEEHPFLLSGGEKRRLSVGTALITRPEVIALDEPTFGQDRARATELLDLLQELQATGTTIVIVTHDLDLVAAYATHTVVLRHGKLLAAEPAGGALPSSRPRTGGLADIPLAPSGTRPEPASQEVPVAQLASRHLWDMVGGEARGESRGDEARGDKPRVYKPRGDAVTEPSPTDPYAETPAPARVWLHHLNPLAKIAAVIPAMVLLVTTRGLLTPTVFLALSYALVLTGARLTSRSAALLLLGMPAGIALLSVGFSIWIAPDQVAGTGEVLQIGDWTLREGALLIGLATALRLAAILGLALIGGLTTSGPDLVRAAVQQLRVPYRIGYTALAAYRFVPRFGYELAVIRATHRVRGHGFGGLFGGRGPIARLVRGWGYIVPLLASGIRHAERVALSMDARAFGAHPTRTERHILPFRTRDVVFIVAVIGASIMIFVVTFA